MKITGQILKENRERKGVSLSEVSLSTKITIKTLVAIEEGDPANLPPKTFLRGFVRSYAIFLGVDVDEILRTFHEEMGSTLSRPAGPGPNPSELNAAATEAAATTPDEPQERVVDKVRTAKKVDAEATLRDEPSLVTKGGIVGGILLLIILIVFLKGKMDSYESERTTGPADPASVETVAPAGPDTPAATPIAEAASTDREDGGAPPEETTTLVAPSSPKPSATPTPTPKPSATPTPTASPKPSPTPTPKPSATPTPTASPKPSPTPTPKPSATPTPTASPKPSASPAASPAPSATPKPVAPAPAGKSHEILIEALDQVDIEATIDGEAPRTIKLKGDQVQSIKVKRKATLKLSDGGAVNLIVNGVDRGVPGDLGKPARVELP